MRPWLLFTLPRPCSRAGGPYEGSIARAALDVIRRGCSPRSRCSEGMQEHARTPDMPSASGTGVNGRDSVSTLQCNVAPIRRMQPC